MQPPGEPPVDQDVTAVPASPVAGVDTAIDGSARRGAAGRDGRAGRADTNSLSEGELAQRIAAGDRAAAGELVRRYDGLVRGFLRKVCFDRDAVEDLAQETFVRALRYAHRFDPKYPMRTWLLTIARRLSINHGQKAKRRRGEPGRAGVAGEGAGVEPVWLADASAPAPPEEAQRAERAGISRSLLDGALARLTEPQRAAIVMHYQQEMPLEEIAGTLDMPVGTVKSHLHRGRKRMRELLEPRIEDVTP